MNKKQFAKIILVATTAAVLPAGVHADDEVQGTTGIELAAGCSHCGASKPVSYNTYNDARTNTYDASDYNQSRYNANPTYTEGYRSYGGDAGYNTGAGYNPGYNTGTSTYNTTSRYNTTAEYGTTLTEADLLNKLSPQGKAIYQSLDSEGKAKALELASQDTYKDKNLAVKEAQRFVNQRRGISPNGAGSNLSR